MKNKTIILTRLRYFYNSNKRMPTYREMCTLLGYKSKGAVRYVVQKLIEDDILEKDEERNLVPKNLLSIPLLGVIKAGYPMPAEVQEDRFLNLHLLFSNLPPTAFALTVSGDSMLDEGIFDGDIVIIDNSKEAKSGDIVAACVDGEWTVKYLQKQGVHVTLVPANKRYPILYPKQSLEIGGVVAHVLRNYR